MARPRKPGDRDIIGGVAVTRGSDNVFADLGLPDAEVLKVKAGLAREITALIDGIPQRDAAEILGIDQPKISALVRGKLKDFSAERLMTFLTRLGQDVEIRVRAARGKGARAGRLMMVRDGDAPRG